MSVNSYVRCWLHIIWNTRNEEKVLTEGARKHLSNYLYAYAKKKGIYMPINFVNPEHVHALINLPTHLSIEEMFHLLKGSSSNWLNESDLLNHKFSWAKGYAGFSVSHSKVRQVRHFIANQERQHWNMSFAQELEKLLRKHELVFYKEN